MFQPTSRRAFCRIGAIGIGASMVPSALSAAVDGKAKLFSAMGIAGPLEKAAMLKSHGAEFLTEGVGPFLMPDKDDAAYSQSLENLRKSPLPVLACNGFIRPAHLRAVGREANHDQIMEWAVTTFRRMKQANGKFIVFGSSGARALRDGWPKEKADKQFVALLKLMGPAAAEHGVTVVVEQLQASECNYINHIGEAAALIRETAHPNIRLLADFFHMIRMGDTPADLKAAMDVVVHIEIAENKDRTYPGVMGDNFRPYLRVLRESGYQGAVSIEGKGTEEQLALAFAEIAKQASES